VFYAPFIEAALSEPVLKMKAKAFIEAKNARQQPNTREQDIDHFISLLADNFIDEHVKYQVTVSDKAEMRAGMIAKMKDEVYYSNIRIDDMIVGANVVFLKYTEKAKVKPVHLDRIVEYTSSHLLSLEINDEGLITHIRRHHAL
jgi:hypothetical protein